MADRSSLLTMTVTVDDSKAGNADVDGHVSAVFLDLDTVLLAVHPGRRGVELGLQDGLPESIERLQLITDKIVVVVEPAPAEGGAGRETERRLAVLREGLGPLVERLIVVACPHGEQGNCECAKPNAGLIDLAITEHGIERRTSWHIGADQEGVQAARAAGLRTIRIGPLGEDHMSAVHRADYDARDLLDAANRIMLESLPVQ
jgi:hypothetical protein